MLGDTAGDRGIYYPSEDQPVVTRVPEHDMDKLWAWRFEPERCDDECHHPMHAFHPDRGVAHLTWFMPGTHCLISEPAEWERGEK